MKKICFIAQFPPPIHGLSKAVDTLYKSSSKDVKAFTSKGLNEEEYDSDISSQNNLMFKKIDITNNKKIIKNIMALICDKSDLYYFTNSQTIGGNLRDLLILWILRCKKSKCLMHLHGGYYRILVEEKMSKWQRRANYKAVGKLDGVIVLGDSLHWIFEGMIDSDKIYTVPNCVDDLYFEAESDCDLSKEKDAEINKSVHSVLYLSNFIKEKGYREVLFLAVQEKDNYEATGVRRFIFDFAGAFFDENEKYFFEKFIKENSLEEYVTYHGVVSGKEKIECLRNADFFILPTRYSNEGQPISILEAMGNREVVITTNHAGIPDLVCAGDGNIIIDKEKLTNPDEINKVMGSVYEMMKEMVDSPCRMEKVQQDNWKKVTAHFREEHYLANMRRLFMEI